LLKFNSLCAFVALVAAPVVVADELSETGEFLDGVAAIVNEGVVLKSQLNEQLEAINARAAAQGIQLPPAEVLQEQILERLIIAEIQLQRAERIGLNVGDEMLNRAIGNIAQENGVPFEDMPRLLAEDGIDYGEFRRQLREEITISNLRTIEVGESINVSEREIEQCVADLEGNVVANSEYSLSHILLTMPDGASATEVKEVEDLANQVYAQIQNGADFREMAVRYSAGPTALEGGTLGWMQGQQVPTLFTDVLQDMGKGDVAPPIRAASSFHIVKVDDLRSAVERSQIDQTNVRHILIMPNEIIDDATAKQRLDEALAKIRAGEEDFGEQAKLLSDDPGSSNLGGELGWATAESFAPEFAQTIRDSEIGGTSCLRQHRGPEAAQLLGQDSPGQDGRRVTDLDTAPA
jgi:peptidyl-prolyl cis-trans isomerase SurA